MPIFPDKTPLQWAIERYWPRVKKTEGCWLWTGHKDLDGYGGFMLENRPSEGP